jgi:hypothetical protein
MPTDRFYIGYLDNNTGLETDLKPYALPDNAFSVLNNAYHFRGRIRKRFGSRWFGDTQLSSRLRVKVGTTDGGGNITQATGPIPAGLIPLAAGQIFSIGPDIFTIPVVGPAVPMLHTNIAGGVAGAINTTNGNYIINDPTFPLTDVYFYPALPVMGLITYESSSVNNEVTIGFDTKFAYQYNVATNGWERIAGEVTPGAATWTGDNSQFFWGANWSGLNAQDRVLYVTNFNELEPNFMRFLFNNQWDNFQPQLDPTLYLNSALIIVPFHNRLVCFNTWEGAVDLSVQNNFVNRARYSKVGSPLDANAFRQDTPGLGNFIDASTNEAIVTVEFIKDRLIVYFERSTWELVYQGNQAYPFTWQQINTELGAESTFSIVPFDKIAIGVGNVGIHACNSQNVERIDNKIPESVFDIHNDNAGVERVYGIRDYDVEMVYWTFPAIDASTDFPYPTRVLIYNYKTGNWAFNDDSITVFGYFQPVIGVTWDSLTVTWDDPVSWDSGTLQSQFQQVVAGNQEGYTFIIDADEVTNAAVLQITNIAIAPVNNITITCIDHNLRDGDFIFIRDVVGSGNLTLLNNMIFKVHTNPFALDPNSFLIIYQDALGTVINGVYFGGGTMARVSQINLTTKEFNFYANKGRNAYVSKVDFLVDSTPFGQIEVDFFVSSAINSMVTDSGPTGTNSLLGTGNLETFPYPTVPLEIQQERLWHPVYFQADGEYIQLQLQLNEQQMLDFNVMICDFQLHALVVFAQPSSTRLQ